MGISLGQVHRILNDDLHMQWTAICQGDLREHVPASSRKSWEKGRGKKTWPESYSTDINDIAQFKQNCGMHLLSFNQRTSYIAPNCGMITGLAIMSLDDYMEGQHSPEERYSWYREINSF
jgi:hypothetical protein